jgi:hypothetical protein
LLGSLDDGSGEVGQAPVTVAGAAAQQGERVGDVQVEAFGHDALGLFDQDTTVQRGLQLFGDDPAAVDGTLL